MLLGKTKRGALIRPDPTCTLTYEKHIKEAKWEVVLKGVGIKFC